MNHHILLSHRQAFDGAIAQILRMGQTEQTPRSETLGQGELQGNRPVSSSRELGIEEGGLIQVLTHLYGSFLLWSLIDSFVGFICRLLLNRLLLHFCHGHHRHRLIHHHPCGFVHLHTGTHHRASGEMIAPVIRRGIDTMVKDTEQQLPLIDTLPIERGTVRELITAWESPMTMRHGEIIIR